MQRSTIEVSRLFSRFTEKQPPKVIINDPKEKLNIEGVESSGYTQSEDKSHFGHMRVLERSDPMLLGSTDEPHRLPQRYTELPHANRRQQNDKQEAEFGRKRKAEREEAMHKRSNKVYNLRERHGSLPRERRVQADDNEVSKLERKAIQDRRETLKETEVNFKAHLKEIAVLKGTINRQTTSLDKAMGSKKAAEQETERLRLELNATRGQLRVCKDDLFRLQPVAQLPDTEIVKEFEALCQDVVSWIDIEISAFEKSHPGAESGHIFSGGQLLRVTYLLEHFPTFGEYLVRCVVHECLLDTMFSRSVYLLGLPEEIKQYLRAAEERMANLDPPRDFETINTWRSETLRAIAATPKLATDREAEINYVLEKTFETVGQFFPIIHFQTQSKQRLLNEVVLPAASLASKVQVAASIYLFWFPANPFLEYDPIKIVDHETTKMIDIKTRKTIKVPSIVVQDGKRRIGKHVTTLEPVLWRINENEDRTLLRRETILIELDQPLSRRINASS